MQYLRDLWHFDDSKNPSLFYGKLKSLNTFFDNEDGYNIQVLKQLQIDTLKKSYPNKESVKTLNQFLSDLQGSKGGTEDDLFAKLVKGINEGLNGFEDKRLIWSPEEQGEYQKKLEDILQKILKLVQGQVQSQGRSFSISIPSLQPLIDTIGNDKYDDFIHEKGQYLEDLGAWIMQAAGLTGFSTGAWQTQDSFFNESQEASIIEDVMGLLSSGIIEGGNKNSITLSIVGYNKSSSSKKTAKNKALQAWIQSIQDLNGKNLKVEDGRVTIGTSISTVEDFISLMSLINQQKSSCDVKFSIVLSDNLHQQIRNISANIQAKSNVERHLANDGLRTLYSIPQSDDTYNKLQKFSTTKPVIEGTAVTEEEQNKKYKVFAAYVNWHLSKNINNTVYGRNEFYLTAEGFVDLATLMQKRGFLIRIKNKTLSYQEFLTNKFGTTYK